ncbi:ubiquinone/menaquinone biosynthesis methyltransferase [Citrobacter koseri]|uniref:Ubiquinone/menaquinone biosynthesis methyltransferase n=1 Tax=Citrobacter koseri TaxID=545 RepID=A0A3S4M6H1_CITKO|nr:ubiquinone/menaquinone biosynthesis methyltransferase [Citrobacter koseri]
MTHIHSTFLPRIGSVVANDADSYRYLAESIRMHPDQDTLKAMMQDAGFESVDYYNLTAGVVALHRGYKFLTGDRGCLLHPS